MCAISGYCTIQHRQNSKYLHCSLDLCNDVLQGQNEELFPIRAAGTWLEVRREVVFHHHVQSIGWGQLELHEVAIDLRDHVLQEEVLLGLVEGEGSGEDPLHNAFGLSPCLWGGVVALSVHRKGINVL